MDALEEYLGSVFVEDAALSLPKATIAICPGTLSRLDEAAVMVPVLAKVYGDVFAIYGDGIVDGGDILTTERESLIGTSARTNSQGIDALRKIVARWDYTVREVQLPIVFLHFKADYSLLDNNINLSKSNGNFMSSMSLSLSVGRHGIKGQKTLSLNLGEVVRADYRLKTYIAYAPLSAFR